MMRRFVAYLLLASPLMAQESPHGSHHVEPRFDPLVVQEFSTAFDRGPFVLPKFDEELAGRSLFGGGKSEAAKWLRQGMALVHYGEMHRAQQCFRMALKQDPSDALSLFGLCLANESVPGRAAMFVRKAQDLVEEKGADQGVIKAYAKYYRELRGDRAAAGLRLRQDLEKLAIEHPEELEIRALVVRLLVDSQVESPLAVEALISQILTVCPKHAVAGYRLEIWRGVDTQRSIAAIDELLMTAPKYQLGTWIRAMRFYGQTGRLDLAAGCFQQAVIVRAVQNARAIHTGNVNRLEDWRTDFKQFDQFRKKIELQAQRIVELHTAGDQSAAFKLFDQNFRYSYPLVRGEAAGRLAEIAAEMKLPKHWILEAKMVHGVEVDPGLVSFAEVAPKAAPWLLEDEAGTALNSTSLAGKTRVYVFFLGAGCDHCMGQIESFALNAKLFEKAGIELLAISTDTLEGLKKTRRKKSGEKFPFPIVSDSDLDVFKAYLAFDQFSEKALHATVIVRADEKIHWREIGGQPFHDIAEVLKQAKKAAGTD